MVAPHETLFPLSSASNNRENVTIMETTSSHYTQSDRDSDQYHDHDEDSTVYVRDQSNSPSHSMIESHDSPRMSTKDPLYPRSIITALGLQELSQNTLGLLANYLSVGFIHGFLQALAYPYLKVYLNMDEYRAAAAEAFLALPWSFKLVFAFISDTVLIYRLRRKPYLYIGWSICAFFAFIIVCIPSVDPYKQAGVSKNGDAPNAGSLYIGLLWMMVIGLVITDTACDGIVVERTQLESKQTRGSLIMLTFAARYTGHAGITFLTSFLCNSTEYGGSFGWSPSLNVMCVLPVLTSIATIIVIRLFLVEELYQMEWDEEDSEEEEQVMFKCYPRLTLTQLRTALQQQVMWQMMIVVFLLRVCTNYYATTTKVIYEYWLDIHPILSNIFTVINSLVFALVAMILRQSFLATSWHRLIAVSIILSILFTIVSAVFTIVVVRNPFLTVLMEQLSAFLDAIVYYTIALAMVEAVPHRLECTLYAVLTSVANASVPFAVSLSQSIGAHFDTYDSNWRSDTGDIRWRVFYAYMVWMIVRVMTLPVLRFLPRHHREMQILKDHGRIDKRAAILVTTGACFIVFWATIMSILASFETTTCLTVAGGEGC